MNSSSTSSTVYLDPAFPIPLIIIAAVLLAALTLRTYFSDAKQLGYLRCIALTSLRLIGLSLVFLILLNPQREYTKAQEKIESRVIIALDRSASMQQHDGNAESRWNEALITIENAGLVTTETDLHKNLSYYTFSTNAVPTNSDALKRMIPDGDDTRFHQSVQNMLADRDGRKLAAIMLLTDGHDFELTNPARTALEARNNQCPIYALPLGSENAVRDAAIHIASYKPYVFVRQHARIDIAMRLIDCAFEDFKLDLYREGELVASRQIAVGEERQRLESFEVLEEEPGQYAYEVRLSAVNDEATLENNRATTFLNVSNKKINLLIVEGEPYWDTNFTQRALWTNEKYNVDAIISVNQNKKIRLRKDPALGALEIPQTSADFDAYDCVLLGQHVDRILSKQSIDALKGYVEDYGGNVIFTRGSPTLQANSLQTLLPVHQGKPIDGFSELETLRAGRSVPAFDLIRAQAGQGTLRSVLALEDATPNERSTVLAGARIPGSNEPLPAMAHSHFGVGQTLWIGTTGLWRTGFHNRINHNDSLYTQFWDNLILWMIAARNVQFGEQFSALLNTANLPLGQTLHIRVSASQTSELPTSLPVQIKPLGSSKVINELVLQLENDNKHIEGSYQPEAAGLYQAHLLLPDGSEQNLRFAVYQDNREITETAADLPFLEALTNQSGGRIIEKDELEPLIKDLLTDDSDEPITTREPSWDLPFLALFIAGCFAADWYLRRKWGLC